MTLRFALFLYVLIFDVAICQGQTDRNFSMFYEEIPALNPAAVGSMEQNVRVLTNYRRQWKNLGIEPYRTYQFSIDGNLGKRPGNRSFFGYGLSVLSDHLPGNFRTDNVRMSIGSGISINRISDLSLGLSLLYGQIQNDVTNLLYASQWSGDGFDASISSGEFQGRQVVKFLDVGAGVYYRKRKNQNHFYVGISASHLNRPNISAEFKNKSLYTAFSFQIGGSSVISNSQFASEPHGYVLNQGPNTVLIFGNNFRYYLSKASSRLDLRSNSSIHMGIFYRTRDGIFVTCGYSYSWFSLAASWDLSLSNLSRAGSFELLLRTKFALGSSGYSFRK